MRRIALTCLLTLVACSSPPPAEEPQRAAEAEASAAPSLSQPVDWPGVNYAFEQGAGLYFLGQPDEEGLKHAAALGVRTVINLRDDDLSDVPFDEAAVVEGLGMSYQHVPISSRTFTPDDVRRFGALIESADGPVLFHCRSSNRVGGLWATHLVEQGRIAAEEALDHGKAAGLRAKPTVQRMQQVSAELSTER